MPDPDDKDEVNFDYQPTEDGRTHILVVDFPDYCDELCFLISLKAYLKARSRYLQDLEDGIKPH